MAARKQVTDEDRLHLYSHNLSMNNEARRTMEEIKGVKQTMEQTREKASASLSKHKRVTVSTVDEMVELGDLVEAGTWNGLAVLQSGGGVSVNELREKADALGVRYE